MSTAVFPTLAGQGWSVIRTPNFSTRMQTAVSGKETAIAEWSYPRYDWMLVFNVLRQGLFGSTNYVELSTLMGFFESRKGRWDSFLFKDLYDNAATAQNIAIGDGTTAGFQLVRSYGGAACPVFAPNLGVAYSVYINAVLVNPLNYTITPWGTTDTHGPGVIVFNTPPAFGDVITATFQYYWPCRFLADQCIFDQFLDGRFKVAQIGFRSIKS